MTRDVPKIVGLKIRWATTRIEIPFLEKSPADYVLEYDIEVDIRPAVDEKRYPRRSSQPSDPGK